MENWKIYVHIQNWIVFVCVKIMKSHTSLPYIDKSNTHNLHAPSCPSCSASQSVNRETIYPTILDSIIRYKLLVHSLNESFTNTSWLVGLLFPIYNNNNYISFFCTKAVEQDPLLIMHQLQSLAQTIELCSTC